MSLFISRYVKVFLSLSFFPRSIPSPSFRLYLYFVIVSYGRRSVIDSGGSLPYHQEAPSRKASSIGRMCTMKVGSKSIDITVIDKACIPAPGKFWLVPESVKVYLDQVRRINSISHADYVKQPLVFQGAKPSATAQLAWHAEFNHRLEKDTPPKRKRSAKKAPKAKAPKKKSAKKAPKKKVKNVSVRKGSEESVQVSFIIFTLHSTLTHHTPLRILMLYDL